MGYIQPKIVCITIGTSYVDPVDATTYYGGHPNTRSWTTTANISNVIPGFSGTLRGVRLTLYHATLCTNESLAVSIRMNNTTDYAIKTAPLTLASGATTDFSNFNLNIPFTATDYFEIKVVCPTWATNPTDLRADGTIIVEY
jgi:hypothetical protein